MVFLIRNKGLFQNKTTQHIYTNTYGKFKTVFQFGYFTAHCVRKPVDSGGTD